MRYEWCVDADHKAIFVNKVVLRTFNNYMTINFY